MLKNSLRFSYEIPMNVSRFYEIFKPDKKKQEYYVFVVIKIILNCKIQTANLIEQMVLLKIIQTQM